MILKRIIVVILFSLMFLFNGEFSPIFAQKLTSEETVIIQAVNKALPAIVTIQANSKPDAPQTSSFRFFHFLGQFFPLQNNEQPKDKYNIGSGFIIDENGLIITNKHVVSDTKISYAVVTNTNKTYQAQEIYRDPKRELAVLRIDEQNLPTVELSNEKSIKVGQIGIAIGTVLGELQNTVTVGYISGLGRNITVNDPIEGSPQKLEKLIQTDAAINFGNSGGVLLNSSGQVIGITTVAAPFSQSIGFAIPISQAQETVKAFKEK